MTMNRRDFLQAGAMTIGGLSMGFSPIEALAGAAQRSGKSVILLWQPGGPSHIDMWDLKPEAPAEFRGEFKPINTCIPGYQVSEHLPKCAKIVDKICVVRSLTHGDSGHESASHALLTGYKPTNDIPANETPSYGSIVAHEMGAKAAGFPAYVALPQAPRSSNAAYLGVAYNPFQTFGDPSDRKFQVRNLAPSGGMDADRLSRRRKMLARVDRLSRDVDASGIIKGMDDFNRQAFELMTSSSVQAAFDINREPRPLRDMYGENNWGQSCLLARRLVGAGVRFVTVNLTSWDTHVNNFKSLKDNGLPKFDAAYSSLISDLDQRGILDSTMVIAWGEFGRTPRINGNAGRDHWPGAATVVMAGGGLKRGVVLGATDKRAEYPVERPVSPEDTLATMYKLLGIDTQKSYVNEAARPVQILAYGTSIPELIA